MEPTRILPLLLGTAWLLPLASFAVIVFLGPRMGKGGRFAGALATLAIAAGFLLSATALVVWLGHYPLAHGHGEAAHVEPLAGEWYNLAQFGKLSLSIGYYIDGLTVAMFTMVTLVATCIHVYSFGYMHEELEEMTDPLAPLASGHPLVRRGRFYRFYQYLSLFCFSMLGLVVAGNVAMVFVFWELVGICSYFLIGFYIERRSATNAANKAFIVNRVGDFGMIVGLMAVWGGLGTFAFGDTRDADGTVQQGIFSQVRPAGEHHGQIVPSGMVAMAANAQVAKIHRTAEDPFVGRKQVETQIPRWRAEGYGYWLLVIAGLGIFCGCVGKSAQFPLHVWLPDAMEGPTPVSALIHAATMVAAGVYLVGRFYPVFTPEVLLVIAYTGAITLFIAATIAVTATDIKRVLAYSTVSQLGYMMLGLGVGGWIAGLFHLFTHAFFKALLFLGSGSVIHATGTNEMPRMGGLLKKMPWTAWTMFVGCLAITGAGLPLVVGLSGYYSKDSILAQLYSFAAKNPWHGWLFYVATAGAGITSFYMFRLWFLTFVGRPRDHHVYEHAHESPAVMWVPLVVLATLAAVGGWIGLPSILQQAVPPGIAAGVAGGRLLPAVSMPAEHLSHAAAIHVPVTLAAFVTALAGFVLAAAFYWRRALDAEDVRRQFRAIYEFLHNKWYFDELYAACLVRPTLFLARQVARLDQRGIDWVADGLGRLVYLGSRLDDWFDRLFVDGLVNLVARWTYAVGLWLRELQTGNLRQYVMFIAVGTVALFILIVYWNLAWAGI
jgi:NADH-quinone oxidoreductase subunit L